MIIRREKNDSVSLFSPSFRYESTKAYIRLDSGFGLGSLPYSSTSLPFYLFPSQSFLSSHSTLFFYSILFSLTTNLGTNRGSYQGRFCNFTLHAHFYSLEPHQRHSLRRRRRQVLLHGRGGGYSGGALHGPRRPCCRRPRLLRCQ